MVVEACKAYKLLLAINNAQMEYVTIESAKKKKAEAQAMVELARLEQQELQQKAKRKAIEANLHRYQQPLGNAIGAYHLNDNDMSLDESLNQLLASVPRAKAGGAMDAPQAPQALEDAPVVQDDYNMFINDLGDYNDNDPDQHAEMMESLKEYEKY